MMTHNTRFAFNVITNTLAILCLTLGVSWLEPLALPLWLLPQRRKSTKDSSRLTLAGVVLCLAAAVWLFINAWHLGTIFARTPESQWKQIALALFWVCMIVAEGFSWWESRAKNQPLPGASA